MVNYLRINGEVMVWMKKPSVSESPSGRAPERSPHGISPNQKLAAAEKYFRGSPWQFWIFREFIGRGSRAKEPRGPTSLVGAPPRPRLGGLWPPPGSFALVL